MEPITHRGPNQGKLGEICWCGFKVDWGDPRHPHEQYREHIQDVLV